MSRTKLAYHSLCIASLIVFFAFSSYAFEATSIQSIITNPAEFDGKTVTIQGTAAAVKETTSRAGNAYATLQIQDTGGAIKVFTWGHPSTRNGDRVEVTGVFQQVKRVGRYTFYNEIEAQSIKPFAN